MNAYSGFRCLFPQNLLYDPIWFTIAKFKNRKYVPFGTNPLFIATAMLFERNSISKRFPKAPYIFPILILSISNSMKGLAQKATIFTQLLVPKKMTRKLLTAPKRGSRMFCCGCRANNFQNKKPTLVI